MYRRISNLTEKKKKRKNKDVHRPAVAEGPHPLEVLVLVRVLGGQGGQLALVMATAAAAAVLEGRRGGEDSGSCWGTEHWVVALAAGG